MFVWGVGVCFSFFLCFLFLFFVCFAFLLLLVEFGGFQGFVFGVFFVVVVLLFFCFFEGGLIGCIIWGGGGVKRKYFVECNIYRSLIH